MRISDWSSDVCSSDLADRKTCVGCETDCLCNGRSTRPISIIVRLDRFHHFLDDLGRVFWNEDRKWPVHSENVDILIDDLRCGCAESSAVAECAAAVESFCPGGSEEDTTELRSLMRNSYDVFCMTTKTTIKQDE